MRAICKTDYKLEEVVDPGFKESSVGKGCRAVVAVIINPIQELCKRDVTRFVLASCLKAGIVGPGTMIAHDEGLLSSSK